MRPVTTWHRFQRWCRREPVVAGLTAAIAIALVTGTTTSTYFGIISQQKAREAITEANKAKTQKSRADFETGVARDAERLARRRLYTARMNLAQRAWEESDIKLVQDTLDLERPERTGGLDLRNWEWHYLQRLCHAELLTLNALGEGVAFNQDGSRLAIGGMDRRAELHDTSSGALLFSFERKDRADEAKPDIGVADIEAPADEVKSDHGDDDVVSYGVGPNRLRLSFCPDGRRLAASSDDRTVTIWDTNTGGEVLTIQDESDIQCMAFNSDGARLAAGLATDKGDTVRVWDAATGRKLLSLRGHTKESTERPIVPGGGSTVRAIPVVQSVAFSRDGKWLTSGSGDGSVKVWECETGRELVSIQGDPNGVNGVAFSPDGTRLAVANDYRDPLQGRSMLAREWIRHDDDKTITVWDAATGRRIETFRGHSDSVNSVVFSPDGSRLASSSRDRTIRVWAVETGGCVSTFKGHTGEVGVLAFSPDASRLASQSLDGTVKVWDASRNQEHLRLNGHSKEVTAVAFSPDGSQLLSGGGDGTLNYWSASTGKSLRSAKTTWFINTVTISPDGSSLGVSVSDGVVFIVDNVGGREIVELKGREFPVKGVTFGPYGRKKAASLRFSPDGKRLASGNADKVTVWDIATRKVLPALETDEYTAITFNQDGTQVATGSQEAVKVQDTVTGKVLFSRPARYGGFRSLAFSLDGQWLAAGSYKAVMVWDIATGGELLAVKNFAGAVLGVSFNQDATRLATGCYDGSVKLWDVNSGQELLWLRDNHLPITTIAFSPDGTQLAAGIDDGTVFIWNGKPSP